MGKALLGGDEETSGKNKERSLALLEAMNFPFIKSRKEKEIN